MSDSHIDDAFRADRRREVRALSELGLIEISNASAGIHTTHRAISDRVFAAVRLGVGPLATPVKVVHDLITDGVYRTITGSTATAARAGGRFADLPLRSIPSETVVGAGVIGAVNGLIGDELADERSPLATTARDGLSLRVAGQPVPPIRSRVAAAYPDASGRIAIFIHGLSETEHVWRFGNEKPYADHLADAHDITAVFVRYNTGRRISHNAKSLAALINDLLGAWPVPVTDITLIGHSMGGLVARSAAHHADAVGMTWTRQVGATVSLGTPHLGAPLESAAHYGSALLARLPETEAFARLLRRRSGGIRDLRAGSLVDADWHGRDPDELGHALAAEIPLLPTAKHYFVSATITRSPRNPLGRLIGDGLVLQTSASGAQRARRIGFDPNNGMHIDGAHHLALLAHPVVAQQLTVWLRTENAIGTAEIDE